MAGAAATGSPSESRPPGAAPDMIWLPTDALWSHDVAAAVASVQAGAATAEHSAYVARLAGMPGAEAKGG